MRIDDDFVGGLGPDKGFAAFTAAVDERLDGGLEFFDAGEAAARMAWRVMIPKGTVALSVRVLAQQEIMDGSLQIMYGIDGRRDLTETTRNKLTYSCGTHRSGPTSTCLAINGLDSIYGPIGRARAKILRRRCRAMAQRNSPR